MTRSTRYIPHALEWHEVRADWSLAKQVHEPVPEKPVFSGLLDASGTKLYRVESREPIGFVHQRKDT